MSSTRKLYRAEIVGIPLLVVGVIIGVYTGHGAFVVDPQTRATLEAQKDAELGAYLNSIGARFTNDEQLSITERLDILREDHRLNADQLGKIQSIQNNYESQRAATFEHPIRKPLSSVVVLLLFVGLFLVLVFGRWGF